MSIWPPPVDDDHCYIVWFDFAVLQIAELQSDVDSSAENTQQLRESFEEQMVCLVRCVQMPVQVLKQFCIVISAVMLLLFVICLSPYRGRAGYLCLFVCVCVSVCLYVCLSVYKITHVGCVVLFIGWFHRCVALMCASMHRTFNRWTE